MDMVPAQSKWFVHLSQPHLFVKKDSQINQEPTIKFLVEESRILSLHTQIY